MKLLRIVFTSVAAFASANVLAQSSADALSAGFAEPPVEARPMVFWQWVNGNVTQQGIQLDLEWMQRIGLAGALMFDVGFRTPPVPQYVEQRVGYGSKEWQQAVRFAAAEAKRLGLSLGVQSSGGWSVSGGPMVTPPQAMKKLVWSETIVTATATLPISLQAPPAISGPYQDVPIQEQFREPTASADVAVIAYRLPDIEQKASPPPKLSGVTNVSLLDDRRYAETIVLAPDANGEAVVNAEFASGSAARSVTIAVRDKLSKGSIEASADGIAYQRVIEFPGAAAQPAPVQTFSLPERKERFWRVRFAGLTKPLAVAEIRFDVAAAVDRVEDKAAYGVLTDYEVVSTTPVPASAVVAESNVLDLTARMTSDGRLSWRPKNGRWKVLRFGWSLTGRRDTPATDETLGLEVDKLDPVAVRAFAENFYDRYLDAMGDAGRLNIALADSWEAGQQNWTPQMFEQFQKRRGYDLRPWMPVLTGRIVGDSARSDKFLADFRRTIADMLADNHYAVLAQVARERNMQMYAEAAGTDLPTVVDGLQAKGRVDVPVGEYWFYPEGVAPKTNHVADIREAASAAHTYGHRIVAAEALTSQGEEPWALGPGQLRRITDRFFAEGVNRVVLHTSAHQPFTDRKPGMTLRQYGQHFTRNETWAEEAGAWVRYLARTSYLLQQGRPVADLAVFLGEGAALSPPFDRPGEPHRLEGYDYDFLSAEVLLSRITVRERRLILPDGVTYRALVIPASVRRMSLPVIEKLRSLVEQGAVIFGDKPIGAHGLAASDEQVLKIANQTWGKVKSTDTTRALLAEKIAPDVVSGSSNLHWTHRSTPDAEIYFLTHQSAQPFSGEVRFRVTGHSAEIWNAVDGTRIPANYDVRGDMTSVHVDLEPFSSTFIVFRGKPASAKPPRTERTVLATLEGPWTVEFLEGRGAPASTTFKQLSSWTDEQQPGIRYYSGRARYTRTMTIPKSWLGEDARIELDLGEVGEMARVSINGNDLGLLWNRPFRKDITDALRAGTNRIQIVVTNYWVNRLIGDQQPGAEKYTFAPIQPYAADSPLRRSGLLGPVRLIGQK